VDSVSIMGPFAAPRSDVRERRWAKNGCKKEVAEGLTPLGSCIQII
jgi:hypothetical protein